MGSFDLGGSFAAGGAAQALRDLFAQRVQQTALLQRDRALAEETRQHLAEEALRGRGLDEQAAYRQMQQNELNRTHQANEAIRLGTEGEHQANTIPPNTFLPETDPAVATMDKTGYGSLLTKQPAIQAQGPDFQGPTPEGTTIADYANGRQAGRLKTASAKQQADAASQAQKTAAEQRAEAAQKETARHNSAMETAAANKPAATVVVQTVDGDGNPITKIVPKTAGDTYVKPAPGTVANRVASAETVNAVGNDLIQKLSDPKVASQLGPAMGRYNNLREFVGNPPPELAELAGQIESYALANMGVHGMRSAQGAQKITELLDRRHTPESLAATIRGLSDFSSRFAANNKPKAGATPQSGSAPVRHRYDMNGNPIP